MPADPEDIIPGATILNGVVSMAGYPDMTVPEYDAWCEANAERIRRYCESYDNPILAIWYVPCDPRPEE